MGRREIEEKVREWDQKRRVSPKNWKTMSKLLVFGILLFEAIQMIAIKGSNSENVVGLALGFLGSIALLSISALLRICFDDLKSLKARIVKEGMILAAILLFLFSLQNSYFQSRVKESNALEVDSETLTVYTMFTVLLLMENLLGLSIISQMTTIFFFFTFSSFKIFEDSESSNAGVYFKLITPGIYLMFLTYIKLHNPLPTAAPMMATPASPTAKPLLAEKMRSDSPWLKFIDDSVFTCDRNGKIKLRNGFFMRNFSFKDENELLSKIEELKLKQEEKLDDAHEKLQDYEEIQEVIVEEKSEQQPTAATIPKKRTYNKIAVNIGVDPMENLASLLKSTLLSIANKEFKEPKLLKYYGEIRPREQVRVHVQIKIYVLPGYEYPMVVVVKNSSSKKEVEGYKNFEISRSAVMASFYSELTRVVELSKSLIRVEKLQSTCSAISNNEVSDKSLTLIQPLFQCLNLMSRMIEDNIEYSCQRVHDLKFRYAQCNIKNVIDSVISLFKAYSKIKRVELIFKYHKGHEYVVHTDQDRLFQLLVQLIYNSLKFTRGDSLVINLTGYNKTFKVLVEDPGSEIPEQELEIIQKDLKKNDLSFLKLFTERPKNKGLLITHTFAQGLGKKPLAGINIKSNPTIGTHVWFFVENQAGSLEPMNSLDGKVSLARSPTRNNSFKPFRPSIFKMTFEYNSNSKDTVNSYSELNESVEVKSANFSVFDKLSARGLNSYRTSPRDLVHSATDKLTARGLNSYRASPRDVVHSATVQQPKYSIEIQRSYEKDIILELPDSISSRAAKPDSVLYE